MSETERILSLLKEILKAYHTVNVVSDESLLAESDSQRLLYTVKIFPPSAQSVRKVLEEVSLYRPNKLFVISQIEGWADELHEHLKDIKIRRISPIDIGNMTAEILPFSEHIGIAVKDINEAERKFQEVLGVKPSGRHVMETEGLKISFMWLGAIKVELLEPISESSAVKSFLERRGEGIHHIAVEVQDFDAKIDALRERGYRIIGPRIGATGKRVAFVHPADFMGVLLEIVERGYRKASFEH